MADGDKTRDELLAEAAALRAELANARRRADGAEGECKRFTAAFRHALDAIALIDEAGRYVDVNPAMCELLGYTRDEFLRMNVRDVVPPEARGRFPESFRELLAAGTRTGEFTLVRKDGTTRTVEFRAVPDILPGLHLGINRDVTEQRRREEQYRVTELRFRRLFESDVVAMGCWDAGGAFTAANDALLRLLGRDRGEADAGRLRWTDLTPPDQLWKDAAALEEIRLRGACTPFEKEYVRPDGARVPILIAGAAYGEGVTDAGVFFALDLTERKRSEQALEQSAARLRSLSQRLVAVQEEERRALARELHDEVGQVLTSLRFAVEAAATQPAGVSQERLAEARALIGEALARVRDLSFDLRPALLDHLGLRPALSSFLERFTAATGVRVNFRHAGLDGRFPPAVETAAYRVVQEALTNVARHAGAAGAEVRIWVDAGHLQVQVEDPGAGFDPEAALATGRSSGLPGMHERVTLLGGRLSVESAPGGGTHLAAELPLEPPGPEDV